MKSWGVLVAVAGLAAAWVPFQTPKKPAPPLPWSLVISGDTGGYLSPCGCTSPMTGGIRRRATAIDQLAKASHVVLIDSGNLTEKQGRQSEMKAETMGQALGAMHATAVALTAQDARLGIGVISSVARLSENRLIASDLSADQVDGLQPFAEQGPFLIGSVSPGLGDALRTRSTPLDTAVEKLTQEGKARGKTPVLMLDDSLSAARETAKKFPSLGVIVYRRAGWPPDTAEKEGKVWLVTPGERGKAIVKLTLANGRLAGYRATKLGPEFADQKEVDRLFKQYLRRVEREDLLASVPRSPSDPYAGSASCAPCHSAADKAWHASGHSHALTTLEKVGQSRDPDCVSCHVTGLDYESGFRSRLATPDFAFVGCESCHGPAKAHVLDPKNIRLPKIGKETCIPCHTSDQSPHFSFLTYWQKIAHK